MTREEKYLVFQDLCARLPYHVKCKVWLKDGTTEEGPLDLQHNYGDVLRDAFFYHEIKDIRPYLRPMSSMTEEEKRELQSFFPGSFGNQWLDLEAGYIDIYECESTTRLYLYDANRLIDWLNKKMFDYRGLIPRGCALSTEVFNPY